jgi:hypothetical protein
MQIVSFIIDGFLFSLMGIIIGLILDEVFYKYYVKSNKSKRTTIILILLQLLANVVIIYVYLSMKKSKMVLDKWEYSLFSFSFPAFYFNVQYHLFDRIKERWSLAHT